MGDRFQVEHAAGCRINPSLAVPKLSFWGLMFGHPGPGRGRLTDKTLAAGSPADLRPGFIPGRIGQMTGAPITRHCHSITVRNSMARVNRAKCSRLKIPQAEPDHAGHCASSIRPAAIATDQPA